MRTKLKITGSFLAISTLAASSVLLGDEPIQPIRPVQNINLAQVELGKKLYFDPRLSKSGFISCNSCHNLSMGGTDNLKTSIGHNWQEGPINAPTVLNSSMNVAQFWDGRAKDLKEQAGGPIANPAVKELCKKRRRVGRVIRILLQMTLDVMIERGAAKGSRAMGGRPGSRRASWAKLGP